MGQWTCVELRIETDDTDLSPRGMRGHVFIGGGDTITLGSVEARIPAAMTRFGITRTPAIADMGAPPAMGLGYASSATVWIDEVVLNSDYVGCTL